MINLFRPLLTAKAIYRKMAEAKLYTYKLHDGHTSINRCREMAKIGLIAAYISNQLRILVENCLNCIEQRKNIKELFWKEDSMANGDGSV